ncbi:unnamed protein product [Acanthosepion pharaonis]|uniref:Uncharacterized protein n=1 Tax=Acanthosepion pharaonis TaxID=158019 RepID=A0A812DGI7_ACAPH|nr:unnamed protein product [Sepia pharaonis]
MPVYSNTPLFHPDQFNAPFILPCLFILTSRLFHTTCFEFTLNVYSTLSDYSSIPVFLAFYSTLSVYSRLPFYSCLFILISPCISFIQICPFIPPFHFFSNVPVYLSLFVCYSLPVYSNLPDYVSTSSILSYPFIPPLLFLTHPARLFEYHRSFHHNCSGLPLYYSIPFYSDLPVCSVLPIYCNLSVCTIMPVYCNLFQHVYLFNR